jgi:type I restriction enzyme S subunit
VTLVKDSRNPGDEPATTFHHFSIPAYDEGQEPKRENGADIKSLKFVVGPEDVLLSKLNPAIERVWHIDLSPSAPAVCSTEFLVLRPRAPFHRTYVYCAARSAPFRTELQGLVTGTSNSHQRVQPETTLDLATVLPPPSVLASFESVAAPLLGRIHATRRETRVLASTRDALLPKLISGELRVKDADRFFAKVIA